MIEDFEMYGFVEKTGVYGNIKIIDEIGWIGDIDVIGNEIKIDERGDISINDEYGWNSM